MINIIKADDIKIISSIVFLAQIIGFLFFGKILMSENISLIQLSILSAAFISILMLILFVYLIKLERQNQIQKFDSTKAKILRESTKDLAHDIRKPFSMIQGLLKILDQTPENEVKEIVKKFSPEVNTALMNINKKIKNVLELDSKIDLNYSPLTTEDLIASSLNQIKEVISPKSIKLKYQFDHKAFLYTDHDQLSVIIGDLIYQQIKAIDEKGVIRFETYEKSESLHLKIISSSEEINENNTKAIFNCFSKIKKMKSTNIETARTASILNALNTNIDCTIGPKGINVFISLPKANEKIASCSRKPLPKSILELINPNPVRNQSSSQFSSEDQSENEALDQLFQDLSILNKKIKIAIVDDELIYRDLIEKLIQSIPNSQKYIELHKISNAKEALDNLLELNCDLILMDVDLGCSFTNGFNITKSLKNKDISSKIIIHSNRGSFDFHERTIESQADMFIPKLISKTQLLQLIRSVVPNQFMISQESSSHIGEKSSNIIILDDSIFVLEQWKLMIKDIDQKHFLSPEHFLKAIEEDPYLLENTKCIVSDYYFDLENSEYDGLSFAKKLKNDGIQIPIALSSDGYFNNSDIQKTFNLHVTKEVDNAWSKIKSYIFAS